MNDESNAAGADQRRHHMAEAVRHVRGDTPIDEWGRTCGVSIDRLRGWESGDTEMTLEEMHQLEAVAGLPAGLLAVAAGYVGDEGIGIISASSSWRAKRLADELHFATPLELASAVEVLATAGEDFQVNALYSEDDTPAGWRVTIHEGPMP